MDVVISWLRSAGSSAMVKPRCALERHAANLADATERREALERLCPADRKILVLTEGVVPYLSNADVAALAEEVRVPKGETIFRKGDAGESLYVIVRGEVKVHDGDLDLKHLKDRSVFGELAVLDPEPRSASITAIADTHLLRLDREAFLELMTSNMEVVRGVLSVLCDRIREKLSDASPAKTAAQGA